MKTAYDYIYTIYQEGSFTRAAEKLFITQPALSIALRKIEARIGMPLFERNRRPVQLTPAGELYLKTIKKMHGLENDLDREVQELRDFQTGTLTLGGSHYLLSYQIPDLLTAYVQKYPKIHLQLIEEASDTLLTLLEKDELDLTFSCDSVVIRKPPLSGFPRSDPAGSPPISRSGRRCKELCPVRPGYRSRLQPKNRDPHRFHHPVPKSALHPLDSWKQPL